MTTNSVTGQTLNGANTVGTFNGTNTTSGNIALTNTAGPLTITGISETGGGSITVGNTGAMLVTGTVSAGSGGAVNLTSSGTISETGAGLVNTTGTLTTSSVGGQTLNGANTVGGLNGTNTGGAINVNNTASTLTLAGISQAGTGAVTLVNTGSLTITGAVNTGGSGDTTLTSTGAGTNAILLGGPVGNLTSNTVITSVGSMSGTGLVSGINVTLDSATGVGTSPTSRVNTAAGTLAARTTSSGGVFVNEADTVTLSAIGAVANGTVGGGAYDIVAGGAMTVNSMTTSGSFAVKTPMTSTIIAHDTTSNGDQLWDGNVTFNSTESTNGGNFVVTGTTTAGGLGNNALVISSGAGNVTLTGAVNATTPGGQSLTVLSSGATIFGSSIGGTTPLSTFTTDAGGTSSFGGSVSVAGTATDSTTPLLNIGDPATATGNVILSSANGGAVTINSFAFTSPLTLSVNTSGSLIVNSTTTVGSIANPVIFTQTPTNVQTTNPISLSFSSPTQPAALVFAPGSSVSAFLGGSGSSVVLAANASQLLANATVSSVQGTAASAVAEASKVGFDTDSVAQQINYGFVGDVGVSPPMNHTIEETGVSVPEGFGEEAEDDEPQKKK